MPGAGTHSGRRVRTAERRGAGAKLGVVGSRERLSTRLVEQLLYAAETVSKTADFSVVQILFYFNFLFFFAPLKRI